jgi:hypothetical protein
VLDGPKTVNLSLNRDGRGVRRHAKHRGPQHPRPPVGRHAAVRRRRVERAGR